ncbi:MULTISPECIES: class I SAM-dependent methyltransferase [unclassified Picosynechococcus]|uniref:class I SAM-dependent methyltransferase n=1 Tax=unclassified Picosynechococcus TaxID=3079910 RepID=UPI0004A9E1E3|nr:MULTISPECIES: methyltransferase domain-containing protein [unclassified Picosynechococcus]ANV87627.1 methyltransferase type 11 [Picosynechococcus sp. PCC 7117]ANV90799.1 methyltransferase type 11 [Picosynechococcus sp. PCC 8807]
MILSPSQRQKLDSSDDQLFYDYPRFVTHVDDGFIDQLTQLYGTLLQPNDRVLDLMSSWVSHLPDLAFREVVGHGMNAAELAKNRRLDRYFVQNLNADPKLPLADQSFEAVLVAVSVQYLQYPEAVFAEIQRVLTPGGICIVSFSNRMFYQKAIAAWRDSTDAEHLQLVQHYFQQTPGFAKPTVVTQRSDQPLLLQMLGLGHRDPFYAVSARKQ